MPGPGVLLVANYPNDVGYAWNNIYRLFNAIGRALATRGLRVIVSFPALNGPATVLDADVPFETLLFDPRGSTMEWIRCLKSHTWQRDIRYVYFTDQPSTRWQYALLRSWGVQRIVVHSRISVPDPKPAEPVGGMRRLMKSSMARLPWATADRIYAVSNFVAHRLIVKGCLPPAKVLTILNGIDVDYWACEPPPDHEHVTFFTAARAARYKGIPILIEAAAILQNRRGIKNFSVNFAGHGPDLPLFRTAVDEAGLCERFCFLGKLDDTRANICAADVLVVPSAYGDACPSTVSEALASGRPLITTHAGGIPQLVGGERNALLVPPGDAPALADAMAQLIADMPLRREIGERGRRRASQALRQDRYHRTVIDSLLNDFQIA